MAGNFEPLYQALGRVPVGVATSGGVDREDLLIPGCLRRGLESTGNRSRTLNRRSASARAKLHTLTADYLVLSDRR